MTLATYKIREITCDHPSCSERFSLGPGDTAHIVRYRAEREGWRFLGGPKRSPWLDLCPLHKDTANG
jgi:hypothetical protein